MSSFGVREPAFIEYLQKNVHDIRVCFLDFVKENDLIRAFSESFGEQAAIIEADISCGCPNELGHRMLFHVLTHIKAHDIFRRTEKIIGEWQLKSIATKATLGGQTVEVYLSFETGGTFTLYQMLGQGRYHSYKGTWALADGILTGTYSTGKAWGSTYTVDITDSTLTLTSSIGGEVDTYAKTTIPENIKKEAYAK